MVMEMVELAPPPIPLNVHHMDLFGVPHVSTSQPETQESILPHCRNTTQKDSKTQSKLVMEMEMEMGMALKGMLMGIALMEEMGMEMGWGWRLGTRQSWGWTDGDGIRGENKDESKREGWLMGSCVCVCHS